MKRARDRRLAGFLLWMLIVFLPLRIDAAEEAPVRSEGNAVVSAYVAGETIPEEPAEEASEIPQKQQAVPETGQQQDILPVMLGLLAVAAVVIAAYIFLNARK